MRTVLQMIGRSPDCIVARFETVQDILEQTTVETIIDCAPQLLESVFGGETDHSNIYKVFRIAYDQLSIFDESNTLHSAHLREWYVLLEAAFDIPERLSRRAALTLPQVNSFHYFQIFPIFLFILYLVPMCSFVSEVF